ncbi:DNA cytosine methyltransferase|uniref:Cytosine-specific methyltransferase n=1 Tax=Dendrosporobacter quercicolus TaxID=146817 RepID=A0A1H0AK07_9FIRM|nr:DNA cytosine methyltransferase [Dendrosporobacter quercicolus]NSL49633.1 DNA cytosine methyltransferase [Dendrosporobacter quercicolus DSM 1736]SDN33898.1 DNA (cytosine-5)-methyltransferase 1 [Dendrosporobacter quercicolus]
MAEKKYRVLELFCGAGGFSLGFKLYTEKNYHPYEIVGALDCDANAIATVRSSLVRAGYEPDKAERITICGDIREDSVKKKLYEACAEADIIIGGPPCQSFSMIGPRSGSAEKQEENVTDYRNDLFEHYIEVVTHYRPLYFVFENVLGILSKKDKNGVRYIEKITGRLKKAGYCLRSSNPAITTEFVILNAADYGVPQLRERVIIIGNRLNRLNPFPKPTHCPAERAGDAGLLPYVTLRDAIGDLPPVVPQITSTAAGKKKKGVAICEARKQKIARRNLKRNSGADPAEYHWNALNRSLFSGNKSRKSFLRFVMSKSEEPVLTGHIARGQQQSDIILFRFMEEGTSSKIFGTHDILRNRRLGSLIKYKMDSFEDKYKKLPWDKPCSTIFAHLTKDGNRFIHPDGRQGRTITVREAARIQSFPDDYVFEAIGNRRYTYIGNAVPPLLAMAIAGSLFRALNSGELHEDEIQEEAEATGTDPVIQAELQWT